MKLFIALLLTTLSLFASFDKRFYTNLNGNIKVIGNSVLKSTTPDAKISNDRMNLQYIDIDSDKKTFNSSSATIEKRLNSIDIDKSKIVWARLYWLGYLHNDKNDTGIDNIYNFRDDTLAHAESDIKAAIDNQKIFFKIDNGNYISIKPDKIDKYRFNYTYWHDYTPAYTSYIYSASADVTNILKDKNANHKYTVANIPTRAGMTRSGFWFDGLGNFSAWSLVIVYDNSQNPYEKMRNVTVYDGFEIVSGWIANRANVTINFDGFKTPRYAKDGVDSEIAIFAGEGDRYILGDSAVLTNEDGYSYNLPSAVGTDSYFASSIDGVPNREPKIDNNNGIDIHINQVGTKGGSNRPIKTDQTHASLTLSSATTGNARDLYIPTVVSFSTELFVPKICYDYDLKLGDYIDLSSNNREFNTQSYQELPLKLKVMLRSKEADFDLINSKMQIKFNPSDKLQYIKGSAKYSLPNTYAYKDAIEIDSNKGIIAVGNNPDSNGGTISALESIYTKLDYKFLKSQFNGKFDIDLNANIKFDGVHKVNYLMSTRLPSDSTRYIPRCPTSPIYNPIKGMFNIERGDSKFSQSEDERYSLYTQVVGVPYEISIASYKKDSNNRYTEPNKIKTTVELELLRSDTFDNNSSAGYDSICQDPSSITKGVFVKLNNQDRVKIKIPQDYKDYPNNLAIRNATFRIWQLVKKSNLGYSIVAHNCSSSDDSRCFDNIYTKYYKEDDKKAQKLCLSSCSSSSGSSCYNCLKANFSMPICARDNFAIRPASYHIELNDNNETKSIKKLLVNDNSINKVSNIAAGYYYSLEINATKYDTSNRVDGYNFSSDDSNNTNKQSLLSFLSSGATCNKVPNQNVNIEIFNGSSTKSQLNSKGVVDNKNLLKLDEVGNFKLHIEDNDWTKVDHLGYKFKPFPNISDCIEGSNSENSSSLNSKRGCITSSSSNLYKDLKITSHPYRFDLNNTTVKSNPNSLQSFIYINELNNTKALIKNGNVMALNVKSSIVALNKLGNIVNNYKSGCMAKSIDTSLSYLSTLSENSKTNLEYSIYNSEVNNTNVIVKKANINKINELLSSANFLSYGTGLYNNYINYKREYNTPINPFALTIKKFLVESKQDKMAVNLNSNYIPKGSIDLNVTKNIYYAKVKSMSDLYDDIIGLEVKTPIEITIFCDKNLDYCKKYNINTNRALTNEYNWFLSLNHSAVNGDGKAILETNNNSVKVLPNEIKNFINGVDKNVKVVTNNLNNRPYIVDIKPTINMVKNYPWLLFNRYGDVVPNYIYQVRFTSPSAAWSGKGKTGHTINEIGNGRKSKKVDW